MGFTLLKQDKGYQKSYCADTRNDIQNLPTNPDEVKIGSDCVVISDGSVWILNTEKIWQELGQLAL